MGMGRKAASTLLAFDSRNSAGGHYACQQSRKRGVVPAIPAICIALMLFGCDSEPVSRAQADAHSRAYDACAHQAKTGKELANCAYAVGAMH